MLNCFNSRLLARVMRFASIAAIASLMVIVENPNRSLAAELVMLEQTGCEWCERWHEEIGPIYPKTSEADIAPLRRVDIDDTWPEDLKNIRIDQFTPTFILVNDGLEIGRLRGYAGEDFFWFLVGEMIKKLPQKADTAG